MPNRRRRPEALPGRFVRLARLAVVVVVAIRNPAPASPGSSFGFPRAGDLPGRPESDCGLGRRFILLPAALALPITNVLIWRCGGVDSILGHPGGMIAVLAADSPVVRWASTPRSAAQRRCALTLAVVHCPTGGRDRLGFLEQRYVAPSHEPANMRHPCVEQSLRHWSIAGASKRSQARLMGIRQRF